MNIVTKWSVFFQRDLKRAVVSPQLKKPAFVWGDKQVHFRRWKPSASEKKRAAYFLYWLSQHWQG